jgi:hypothetical protein
MYYEPTRSLDSANTALYLDAVTDTPAGAS